MSIAGAAGTTQKRTGLVAARPFIHLGTTQPQDALNDNLERLFRWRGILRRLGISFDAAAAAASRAELGGTTLQVEMVASSLVREQDLYRAIAAEIGLPFQEEIEPRRVVLGGADPVALLGSRSRASHLKYDLPSGESCLLVAPELMELGQFQGLAARYPQTRQRVRVASPSLMREALVARARPHLVRQGRDSLFLRRPELSARTTATA